MYDVIDFDWRTQTTLAGTVSRIGQYVRGDCACGETDTLVYDSYDDPTLMCAACARVRSNANPREEMCDSCGAGPAWRDPVTRKNEFFCARCHAANGTVFQNRWSPYKARESKPIHDGAPRAVCAMKGYGTECKGEVKWRGPLNMQACNKHAGKTGVGPNG